MHMATFKGEADKCGELRIAVELLETLHQDHGELRASFAEVGQAHALCACKCMCLYSCVCATLLSCSYGFEPDILLCSCAAGTQS
jgi:hypothetical protein